MIETSEYIAKEDFKKWYALFKQSKGRFIHNPIDGERRVYVCYSFDDMDSYNKLNESYGRLTKKIVETKRGFIKNLKSRLSLVKVSLNLKTLPADEFPNIEYPDSDSSFDLSLDAQVLEQELSRVQFAMGKEDVRYYLNGMSWEGSEKGIRMASTDGHRLAITNIECKSPDFKIILPRKSVTDLIKLIGKLDEKIDIKVDDKRIQFKCGDLNYTSKLIDGKFPDIERVIPGQNNRLAILDKILIKNVLQQGMITANDNGQIRLTFNKGQLFVSSANNTHDTASCSIDTGDSLEKLEIGFNGHYLIDALSNVSGNEMVIAMKDGNTSSIIKSANDEHYQFIVMPMKL